MNKKVKCVFDGRIISAYLASFFSLYHLLISDQTNTDELLLSHRIILHLLLDEVDDVLQVLVLSVANDGLHHQPVRPLHHLNNNNNGAVTEKSTAGVSL